MSLGGIHIYQLVVCDLDGTLLNNQQEITPYTQQVLKEVMKKVPLVIATARPIRDTMRYLNQLGLKTPSIHCNGAIIYSHADQKVIHSNTIHGELAKKFFHSLYHQGAIYHCWAEQNDRFWVLSEDDEDIQAWISYGVKPVAKGYPNAFFDQHLDKILVHGNLEIIIKQIQLEFHDQLTFTFSDSKKKWLEILSKEAGKASAVRYISKYLNVPLKKMVAFGDADNDLEMLESVGLGVAMGNAPNHLKERADKVTLSNEENGVAMLLERLLESLKFDH